MAALVAGNLDAAALAPPADRSGGGGRIPYVDLRARTPASLMWPQLS